MCDLSKMFNKVPTEPVSMKKKESDKENIVAVKTLHNLCEKVIAESINQISDDVMKKTTITWVESHPANGRISVRYSVVDSTYIEWNIYIQNSSTEIFTGDPLIDIVDRDSNDKLITLAPDNNLCLHIKQHDRGDGNIFDIFKYIYTDTFTWKNEFDKNQNALMSLKFFL